MPEKKLYIQDLHPGDIFRFVEERAMAAQKDCIAIIMAADGVVKYWCTVEKRNTIYSADAASDSLRKVSFIEVIKIESNQNATN